MLDIKVLSSQKPAIEFNYEDVSKYLDSQLSKYKDLVITEESLKDGKKLVADLRKGNKALDDFRKKVKKELSEPIKQFEDECKTLSAQFTETIDPIVEQLDHYENERLEQKRVIVADMIKKVETITRCHGIELKKEYLNKSMSKRKIEEDLFQQAQNIQLENEYTETQKKRITDMCDACNRNLKRPVLDCNYYFRLISNTEIDDIIQLIQDDCDHLKSIQDVPDLFNKEKEEKPKIVTPKSNDIYVERYEVHGTDDQLDMVQDFLESLGVSWKIL